MSDESDPVTAVAKAVEESGKAVQEVAKTGRALIEPGTELANYVARMLGTVPEDVIGFLIGDPLHELRQHTLTGILRAVFEKLRKRGVETAKPIRPGPGKEAFEAASLETDETLQDMWAELLANAMDATKHMTLRKLLIDTLRKFEPADALVFQKMGRQHVSTSALPERASVGGRLSISILAEILKERETFIALAFDNLDRLRCIERGPTSKVAEKDQAILTTLGIELYLSCTGDAPD
ncbi:MAG: Abi-alpha family protein [Kiloniellales bacterium]